MKKKQSSKKLLIVGLCLIGVPILIIVGFLLYKTVFILKQASVNNGFVSEIYYDDGIANQGEFSSLLNDKIYYYSNEYEGINGIYQMDLNGDDVKLLVESPDVRRIAVFDDELYYVGLFNHYLNDNSGKNLKYGIFKSEDFSVAQRIAPEFVDVFDAYFFEDDFILIADGYKRWGKTVSKIGVLNNGVVEKDILNDFTEVTFEHDGKYTKQYYAKEHNSKPVIFIGWQSMNELSYGRAPVLPNEIAIDVLNKNRIFSRVDYNDLYEAEYLIETNEIVYYLDRQMHFFDVDTYIKYNSIDLDYSYTEEKDFRYIPHVFNATDSKIYVMMEVYDDEFEFVNRSTLIVDKDSGTCNELFATIKENDRILYLDENYLIASEDKNIVKYTHNGEKIISTEEIAELSSWEIAVSTSGKWLFIYSGDFDSYGENSIYHTLLCKINIETNEVIKNTMPFDSSQHDEIYVDEKAP